MSSGGAEAGAAMAIIFCVITVLLASVCAINSCKRAGAQQPNGAQQTGTSSGEKDGDMVVLDGGQIAEAVVEIQPGCCCGGGGCGGGGDGGDGGGCGGCGGD